MQIWIKAFYHLCFICRRKSTGMHLRTCRSFKSENHNKGLGLRNANPHCVPTFATISIHTLILHFLSSWIFYIGRLFPPPSCFSKVGREKEDPPGILPTPPLRLLPAAPTTEAGSAGSLCPLLRPDNTVIRGQRERERDGTVLRWELGSTRAMSLFLFLFKSKYRRKRGTGRPLNQLLLLSVIFIRKEFERL